MLVVCGIDPGLTGAIAVLFEDWYCETIPMPTIGEGKQRIVNGTAVAKFLDENEIDQCVVENVASMPGQGVSSVFKFGMAHGQVLGVLQACKYPYRLAHPTKWKRDLGLSRDKSLSRRRAIELFPKSADQFARVKDEGRAEAALLAYWAMHYGFAAKMGEPGK